MAVHDGIDDWIEAVCNAQQAVDIKAPSPFDSVVGLADERKRRRKAAMSEDNTYTVGKDPTSRAAKRRRNSNRVASPRTSLPKQSQASSKASVSSSGNMTRMMRTLRSQVNSTDIAGLEPTDASSFPPDMQELYKGLTEFAEGICTIPRALEARLKEEHQYGRPVQSDTFYGENSGRAQLGHAPTLREARSIAREAKSCSERGEHEAGWNSQVHGQTLTLACSISRYVDSVASSNLTHAKIIPRLRPPTPSSGKMIDFGLYLRRSPVLDAAFHCLDAEEDGGKYWNHTSEETIQKLPLAIDIVTKKEGEGFKAAKLQFMVWVSARFTRLEELLSLAGCEDMALPMAPLLYVKGPQWLFMVARREKYEDGSATIVHSSLLLGDVSTIPGVFKVISALVLIMQWVQTKYRPWFETLASSIAQRQRPQNKP